MLCTNSPTRETPFPLRKRLFFFKLNENEECLDAAAEFQPTRRPKEFTWNISHRKFLATTSCQTSNSQAMKLCIVQKYSRRDIIEATRRRRRIKNEDGYKSCRDFNRDEFQFVLEPKIHQLQNLPPNRWVEFNPRARLNHKMLRDCYSYHLLFLLSLSVTISEVEPLLCEVMRRHGHSFSNSPRPWIPLIASRLRLRAPPLTFTSHRLTYEPLAAAAGYRAFARSLALACLLAGFHCLRSRSILFLLHYNTTTTGRASKRDLDCHPLRYYNPRNPIPGFLSRTFYSLPAYESELTIPSLRGYTTADEIWFILLKFTPKISIHIMNYWIFPSSM